MNEEEQNELFKKAFAKTLKKLAEEPEELFDNCKLQKKYNNSLKEQIKLKKEIERLNNIIYREISDYILKKYGMLDDTHYHDFLNELELKESGNNED